MPSWLSNRLGIHLNLRPLAAPAGAVVGGLLGGAPGAAIGSGLMTAGDDYAHGDSLARSLGRGALTGGITYAGAAGLPMLRELFSGGAGGAGGAAADAAGGGAFGDVDPTMGRDFLGPASGGASSGGGSSGASGGFGSGLRKVGSWLADHPGAVSGTLQGAAGVGQMGAENALLRSQARNADIVNQQNDYELQAKKRRDAALAPLMQAFAGQLQQMQAHPYRPAPNPYTPA